MGWKATGTWHGWYAYDAKPDFPQLPERVGFGMRLRQSWLFGWLSGEVWDDLPGPPERGLIEGRVYDDKLFFLKWMPIYRVLWDGQLMTFTEYIKREFNLHVDKPAPHPPIRYTGEYRADGYELVGTWELVPVTTQVVSEGRAWNFDVLPGSGSWSAQRVPEI